ncbi:MAG TPA: TRAP transporter small permease [Sphaerochaeta sp.]|jgi:TRAP-type C4-dicarboxylate transport system permease small subunit|nr:TRAP transporter small permease [Sphaerochaeta sp.]
MKKLILGTDKFLSTLGIVLNAVLASGVVISVFLRYLFSIAFVESEELLTMVFVATTFFGSALGLREGDHIAITNFVDRASKKKQRIFAIICQVVIIFVSVVMIYYSMRMIAKVGKVPSPATGIKRGWYYAIIPVSFVFTIFYSVVDIVGQFISIPAPDKADMGDSELGFKGDK